MLGCHGVVVRYGDEVEDDLEGKAFLDSKVVDFVLHISSA
jgi:hypothetical protein